MNLRSRFLFEEHSRYSYGWENPNHAAGVLVCLLPLLWAAYARTEKKAWGDLAMIVGGEILVTSMLALTYSRGAVVAWFAALLFFHFAPPLTAKGARSPGGLTGFALRSGLFVLVLLSTGVTKRLATVAAGDGSAINRLELWRGGLQLLESSPWRGWGLGKSGLAYMQWIQDPAVNLSYGGMLNSYLHIGVEFGLVALFVWCLALVWPVMVYLRRERNHLTSHAALLLGCSSGVVAFAVANFFTSLWVRPSVFWAPVLLLAIAAALMLKARGAWWTTTLASAGAALTAVVLCYGSARAISGNQPWKITRLSGDGVLFTAATPTSPPSQILYFFPDGRTLGSHYGKQIRAAADHIAGLNRFAIFPPGSRPPSLIPGNDCVIFGSRIKDFDGAGLQQATIIFPSAAPTEEKFIPATVLLPEFDQIGFGRRWREWSLQKGCRIASLPLAGQSLRGRLSEALDQRLADGPLVRPLAP